MEAKDRLSAYKFVLVGKVMHGVLLICGSTPNLTLDLWIMFLTVFFEGIHSISSPNYYRVRAAKIGSKLITVCRGVVFRKFSHAHMRL